MEIDIENIALFGGSFDPPHIAHVAIVKALLDFREIEKVVVMPTFLNPFKSSSFAPSYLRVRWLKEIFANYQGVEVSDFELKKQKKVPTIESVEFLLKRYKKIYLVIGADNLKSLHKWHRYEELKELVSFIVATRDEIEIPKEFLKLHIDKNISSTMLRKKIEASLIPKECREDVLSYYTKKENNAK